MPIRDYTCGDCGHQVKDVFHKQIDDILLFCPECNNGSLKQNISMSNFILKGKGWFKRENNITK